MSPSLTKFFDRAKSFLDASSLEVKEHVVSNIKGSPKVFISLEEEKEGVGLDLLKSTISFDSRLRDGGYGAVFSFTEEGFSDFIEGKSLAQCAFENKVVTSGSSDNLFLASLYLDELAKEVRSMGQSQALH